MAGRWYGSDCVVAKRKENKGGPKMGETKSVFDRYDLQMKHFPTKNYVANA